MTTQQHGPAAPQLSAASPAVLSAHHLQVHTLVTALYHAGVAESLAAPARALLEKARACGTCSVAELAAACGVPLGPTRDLIAGLAASGQLIIHPDSDAASYAQLGQVLDGLLRLP